MVNPELVDSAIATGKHLIEGKTTSVALAGTESDADVDMYTVLGIEVETSGVFVDREHLLVDSQPAP